MKTGNSREKDLNRGELNLYEMNDNFIDGMFVATSKYILFQGVRVRKTQFKYLNTNNYSMI